MRALQEKDVTLNDMLLLALDEAIRKSPRDRHSSSAQTMITDHPVEFDGTVPTIADLEAQVHRWLRLTDQDVFRLMLAAVAGHRVSGESPWLLIVGPPSSVKTELLPMLSRTAGTVRLSSLTARTFASGLETQEAEPSLLQRLTDHVLVLKDFTTVLELAHDERQGCWHSCGRSTTVTSTNIGARARSCIGRTMGFPAGVTPVIDQHHAVMGLLGPRFLLLRLHSPRTSASVARRALRLARRKAELRRELAEATAAFLAHLPPEPPDLDPAVRDWLVDLADLVTHARSPVSRERGGTLHTRLSRRCRRGSRSSSMPWPRGWCWWRAALRSPRPTGGGSRVWPGTASRSCAARCCTCWRKRNARLDAGRGDDGAVPRDDGAPHPAGPAGAEARQVCQGRDGNADGW